MRNEERIEKLIGISIVVAMITLALAIGGLVIGVIS